MSEQAELSIREVIENGLVDSLYQPIVDLDTGALVGVEALARGPKGSIFEAPAALFTAAAEVGLTAELDWVCRAAAIRGALDAGIGRDLKLFVNVEPAALGRPLPGAFDTMARAAARLLDVVVEVTERALVADPAALINMLNQARRAGYGVAIDDIGVDTCSLALLPFVAPDVIKLDIGLLRLNADHQVASIASAVRADAERRDAWILAEGIETDEHLDRAMVLGARLGQGFRFGPPTSLDDVVSAEDRNAARLLADSDDGDVDSPWQLVATSPRRRTTTRLLLSLSRHIEQRVVPGEPRVVVSAFQHVDRYTPFTRRRYEQLAEHHAMVAVVAASMEDSPGAGVRGGTLPDHHPLNDQWVVTNIGPHDAAALIAREHPTDDGTRSFEFVITHDRDTVIRAARSLLQHVQPT